MSDFIPNKLGFDANGCMNAINAAINRQLDVLSVSLINIIGYEIQTNGNGTKDMRAKAVANIKETKREITNDHILLEVGIDLDSLKGDEELFVNVSVVLHGNMNGSAWTWRDAQVMYTKPGVSTYGKVNNVIADKRVHVPEHYKPRAMYGFAQQDVSKQIEDNVEKEIDKHVEDFMNYVEKAIDNFDWSMFITGG